MKTPSHSHRSGLTISSRLIESLTRKDDPVSLITWRLPFDNESRDFVGSICGGLKARYIGCMGELSKAYYNIVSDGGDERAR
ncbi:hypothetical protein EYZ11_005986 [Aspergillus tanneri]|uniref:Uncharacterized protein n=1 Tax=Aspergillus tanneri TaxID=1220188 RepID=A0A4S3JH66_9EURO|nr:hypothetical protein EYZ11_005986 [Aspergillus tanneri]